MWISTPVWLRRDMRFPMKWEFLLFLSFRLMNVLAVESQTRAMHRHQRMPEQAQPVSVAARNVGASRRALANNPRLGRYGDPLSAVSDRAPLPREFNITDPQRDPDAYLVPVNEDDDLGVLVHQEHVHSGRANYLPSRCHKHQGSLKEFETIEAVAANDESGNEALSSAEGSDDDNEDEYVHVLKELSVLGSKIAEARTKAAAEKGSKEEGGIASMSHTPMMASPDGPTALFLLEREAANLLTFSLSNPQMKAYAREISTRRHVSMTTVTKHRTEATVAKDHSTSAGQQEKSSPSPEAVVDLVSGINANLSEAISNQQVSLRMALEDHHKKQEASLKSHREELVHAQEEASVHANAALKREIGALKRQQQELLRQQREFERERKHEGEGKHTRYSQSSPAPLTVDGGHVPVGQVPPQSESMSMSQTTKLIRNMPQETATLISNALKSERAQMSNERQQWERALRQVQEGAAAQQQAMLKHMRALAGQHDNAVQQSTTAALQKAQSVHDKHTERITKLVELQQRQHVYALRTDASISRQEERRTAEKNKSTEKNVVAAEMKAQKEVQQLASGQHGAGSAGVPLLIADDSNNNDVLLPSAAADSQLETSGGTDLVNSKGHRQAALAKKAKPTKAVLTPSPASQMPRKEDIHAKSTSEKFSSSAPSQHGQHKGGGTKLAATVPDDMSLAQSNDDDKIDKIERERVVSFLEEAAREVVDGGVHVFESSYNTDGHPRALVILADRGDGTPPCDGPLDASYQPVQCVEMCVSTFLSEEQTAQLVGVQQQRDPLASAPRLLTREEAELLVDARKRLQRIREFSIDFKSKKALDSHDADDGDNDIPCFLGEEADTLLLNAVTSKIVHEVIAENVRGFLHDLERRSSKAESGGASSAEPLFPSTGSQGLDRAVLEECLSEFLNVSPMSVLEAPQARRPEKRSAILIPNGLLDLFLLDQKQQQAVVENCLWQEWVLSTSSQQATLSAQQQMPVDVIRAPGSEGNPSWLLDPPPSCEADAKKVVSHQPHEYTSTLQHPPVVNVVVDTSSIADLLRSWGGGGSHEQRRPQEAPPSPQYLQHEAPRHHHVDEELPHDGSLNAIPPQQQMSTSTSSGQYQQPPISPFNIADVEAAVTDRVLRKLYEGGVFPAGGLPANHPLLWQQPAPIIAMQQNNYAHEISGVSSSSSSTSSSSSSSGESVSPAMVAFLQSPEVQGIFSAEGVQRYRFYGDVDQVFGFLREAFADGLSVLKRESILSKSSAAATSHGQQSISAPLLHDHPPLRAPTPATNSTGTITDPITSFLVDWFKTLQVHDLPNVLQHHLASSNQNTLQQPHIAVNGLPAGHLPSMPPVELQRRRTTPSSTSVMSSTNPSSFGDDGMHKFVRYLPADYVASLSHPPQGTHLRPWREHNDTATTETTLVGTATTLTSTASDSSGFDVERGVSHRHFYSKHHQHDVGIARVADNTSSTSSGTHTTISSVSSDDVRHTLARTAMQRCQWGASNSRMPPSLDQSELTAGSRL